VSQLTCGPVGVRARERTGCHASRLLALAGKMKYPTAKFVGYLKATLYKKILYFFGNRKEIIYGDSRHGLGSNPSGRTYSQDS